MHQHAQIMHTGQVGSRDNGFAITRAAKRGGGCNTSQRLCSGAGLIALLCRLTARWFSVLLKQFRNGTQRFVHLLSGSEFACDIGFQNDDISTFGISCGVLAPYAFAEVIFRTHRIFVPR